MATTLNNPAVPTGILRKDPQGAVGTWSYANITGDTTTTVKTGPGILHTITINNPTATEVITIYDQTSATGNKIGTITIPSSPTPVTLTYDVEFLIALTIVTATATSDITISFA